VVSKGHLDDDVAVFENELDALRFSNMYNRKMYEKLVYEDDLKGYPIEERFGGTK
jgi:hypothetical protein